MANEIQRIFQRCYAQIQSAFDTIPNSAGAATVAGSDCCLIISLDTDAMQSEIQRPDKTGTYDELQAQGGRKVGQWSARMSMAGNGSAGTAPDCKNFLQAAFGKVATVTGGVSVAYGLDDTLYYLSIYHFNAPGTGTQMVAFNALVNKFEVSFGGDVPELVFSGECGWVYDNDQAADGTTPALAKGGLTAWPAEPASPVTNGTFPPGYKVTATLDANAYDSLLTGKITVEVSRELRKNTNSDFPRAGSGGLRKVSCDFELTDDDSAAMRGLKQKAIKRTAVNVSFAIGVVAGNIWTFALTNMTLAKPKYGDDGVRRKASFSGSRAYPSTATAKDQLTLTIT